MATEWDEAAAESMGDEWDEAAAEPVASPFAALDAPKMSVDVPREEIPWTAPNAPRHAAPTAPAKPAQPSFLEALASKWGHGGTLGLGDYLGAAFQRSLQPSADEVAPDRALAAHDAQQETWKKALVENQAIREAAGKQQPVASAIANVGSAVLNPLTLMAAPAVGAATGATKALQVGAPWLEKALRVGAAGTALATPATAAQTLIETGSPIEAGKAAMSVAPKAFAMGAAPVPMGLYEMGAALLGEGTPEERLTRGLGGLALTGGGAVQALGAKGQAMAPKLRETAVGATRRALGYNLKDVRQAGGVDRADAAAARVLDEGLIRKLDDARSLANRVREERNATGQQIATELDTLTANASPEVRDLMSHKAVGLQMIDDVAPKFPLVADEPVLPAARQIIERFLERGNEPMSFRQLNDEKAGFGRSFDISDPSNPPPPKAVQQEVYRSLNNQMETLGDKVSAEAGDAVSAEWQANKARYKDLHDAGEAVEARAMREAANRGISFTDYLAGTGGGVSLKSLLYGGLNKAGRERGNSTLAVTANKLSQLAGGPAAQNVTEASRVSNALQATAMPEDERKAMIEWLLSRVGNNGP